MSFLNQTELTEFTRDLTTWNRKLPILLTLARKQARLDNSRTGGKAWQASTPLILSLQELYDNCVNLIADMTTQLTVHHGSRWTKNLPYVLNHVDTLAREDEFPALYAHFSMLNNQLTNALKKPEDKYLAGHCVTCGTRLYATKTAREATCTHCKTLNDLSTTRAQLKMERSEKLENYSFTGTLDQITILYNMLNNSDLMKTQVRKLLTTGKIRNIKTDTNKWTIDTRTI